MIASLLVIALLGVLANLPFVLAHRFLVVIPCRGAKSGVLVALEVIVMFGIALGVFRYMENGEYGSTYQQGWEFYAVLTCLFAVAGFPGFVRRYLWKESVAV